MLDWHMKCQRISGEKETEKRKKGRERGGGGRRKKNLDYGSERENIEKKRKSSKRSIQGCIALVLETEKDSLSSNSLMVPGRSVKANETCTSVLDEQRLAWR